MNNILFLTLKVFSATGGIEKVCRIAGKAMYENTVWLNKRLLVMSMHDKQADSFDNPYFPSEIFRGFGARKIQFVLKALREGARSDIVLLSHINLLSVGWLIKRVSPSTKVLIFCHGIEIWKELSATKRGMLQRFDEILSVSKYTAAQVNQVQGIPASKCQVLNNCLDPFLTLPKNVVSSSSFKKKYGFADEDIILFTLTRLASTERYKGYDKVLDAMKSLQLPNLKYLIAGSCAADEKALILQTIEEHGLSNNVVMAGFVAEEELAAHFKMADIYVMPSSKEGFGIVFIEAMFYGLPVIAGNADGSVDALLNGELGILVDPQSAAAVKDAIEKVLNEPDHYKPDAALLKENFGYEVYKTKLNALLGRHFLNAE
jgi:glycosyltransferase involved in cell wall biosynthesis